MKIKRIAREQQVQRLFAKFVRLRKTNLTPEEAWFQIQQEAVNLENNAQLQEMVQSWETQFGQQHSNSNKKPRIKRLPQKNKEYSRTLKLLQEPLQEP